MTKKTLSVLLALLLVLSLFPTAALAEQESEDALPQLEDQLPEAGPEDPETPETGGGETTLTAPALETAAAEELTVYPDADLPENDELFQDYIDLYLAGVDPSEFGSSVYGVRDPVGDKLGETDKKIYTHLKTEIGKIAENGGSSVVTLPLSLFFTSYVQSDNLVLLPMSYFDKTSIVDYQGGEGSAEFQKISAALEFNFKEVLNALLSDCPYSLYWYDKTQGTGATSTPSYGAVYLDGQPVGSSFQVVPGREGDYTIAVTGTYEITFPVAQDYQDEDAATPATTVRSTNLYTVDEEIKKLVNAAYASDYARLEAYKDYICEAVSYDTSALNAGTAYGDPWQLISVFDKNTSTNVVCEGYAKAFQYLCDRSTFENSNVECYLVSGVMRGGTGDTGGGHMWNVVRMEDGKSYLVDVTNSDEGSAGQGGELFLAGFSSANTSGTFEGKNLVYAVAAGGNTITFQYYNGSESGTIDQYAAYGNVLELAEANYPKPAAAAKVTLSLNPTSVEAPADETASVLVTGKASEEGITGDVTLKSVSVTNSAGQTVSTIKAEPSEDAADALITVKKGTPAGTYTVTVTTADGAVASATFEVTKAASVYTKLEFASSTPASTNIVIPEAGKTGTAVTFTLMAKDQYGDTMTVPTTAGTFQVSNTSGDLTTQFTGTFTNGNRTFALTATATAPAGSATLTVTVGGKSVQTTINAQKFDFPWTTYLANIENANPVYGMTWNQLLSGLSTGTVYGNLGSTQIPGRLTVKEGTQRPEAGSGKQCTLVFTSTDGNYVREQTYTLSKDIAPKPITVTIANASRYYGQENPEFKGTVNTSQLVGSDTETALPSYTLSAKTEAGAAVSKTTLPGTYQITGPGDTPANNKYSLTFVNGTLTVKPAQMKLSLTTDNNTVSKATLEANKTNFTALGLPDDINVVFTEDDKSTVLTIAGADPALNVTWAVTGSTSIDQALAALGGENAPDSVDLTLTPTVTNKPDWATLPTTLPTFTLTVTGREVATITVINWDSDYKTPHTYNGEPRQAPDFKVTDKDGGTLGIGDSTKFSYQFEKADAPGEALSGAPKDAGTYKLVATYRDDTNYGRFSQEFTISPKQLSGLTWAGADTRTYDGVASSVTATVTAANGLIDGDVVNVTVTGGDAKNAGTHTATATGLTGADAGNYTIAEPDRTKEYTINKANRTLTVTIDHAILCPKLGLTGTLKIDCTGDDTAAITLALTDPVVVAYALDSAARASADVVRLDSAARTVTAVGNGTAQVTASVAATTNYNAAAAAVTVTAYAQPVKGITAVTSTDGTAKLAAALDGNAIMVSGFWAEGSSISNITPDLFGSLTSSYADGTLTVKDGAAVVAEYTVNTEAVVFLPSGVKLEEGDTTGTVSATIPEGDSKDQVTAAMESDENKLEGAVESAAKTLVDIATAEAAKPGNDGKTVTVQVDLKIEAKAVVTAPADAQKASYTIDVQPVYSVYVTTETTPPAGTPPVRTENLSSGFATPVTVTVELPAFLAAALDTAGVHLFAKHTRSDGTVEYLNVTVDDAAAGGGAKTATWQMSSFSDVELYAIANKTITVSYKDSSGNVTQTVTYGETDRGGKLLDNKTWTISGQQYTTVDELLDSALTGTVDARPYTAPVTPVDPPSRPSGGGGGGGGGGSSFGSYSISAPTSSSKHGSVSLSTTSARKGDTVTITPKPDAGYVLDTLVVRDSSGKQIEVKAAGDGKYTFVMPAGQVTVEATFRQEGESGSWPFADVDRDSFWAAGAIAWVYEQGYMNGNSASTFNPGGTITRQQMWMILARLSGQNPASFAEARQWAMDSGVSDGTNGPNAMSRQQMVTFLYRYAQLRGYTLTGASDIDAFPDSGLAANYAQEPLAWAVGNGIVTGTSDGALNPTGTATRAHFAVILQRFCENMAKD